MQRHLPRKEEPAREKRQPSLNIVHSRAAREEEKRLQESFIDLVVCV